jgi:hypothetical protein
VWEPDQRRSPIGEGTVVFFDRDRDGSEDGPVVVGFIKWTLRKERVHGPKEYVGEFALISIAPEYRGQKTVQGPSIASTMFATTEAIMHEHEKASEDMPLRIDVDVDNSHAREVYVECWRFKHWKWRPEPQAEAKYEVLLRAATASAGER